MTQQASPDSPILKDCVCAFLSGGAICCIGQALTNLFNRTMGMRMDDARSATSIVLILAAAVLTSLGWFAPIARHAGAGTLVPITGFANSIVSPAMEFKSEGLVLGVGAKMFQIAGPVLVFGITSSAVYGLILWICSKL